MKICILLLLSVFCNLFPPVLGGKALAAIDSETLRLGEQMYRKGILPSGQPMKAYVSGDVPVEGTFFTCVSCHLRSGLGSFEGEVATPPTNGRYLYQERRPYLKGFEFVPSFHNYAVDFPPRPAYTDASLADLITGGVDPTGRDTSSVMPKYEIDDADMAVLIAYVKTLSNAVSPGVRDDSIHFATIIVDGVSEKDQDSFLAGIEFGLQRKNSLSQAASVNDRVGRMGYNMLGPDLLKKRFTLARWYLKGPSDTWSQQLEKYYAEAPPFVLLGGIGRGEWQPVHQFCEKKQLPNLLPVTDIPVLSEDDWYTVYFSRGVRLEGEAAARYLNGLSGFMDKKTVVQLVGPSQKALAMAQGFREEWQQVTKKELQEISLSKSGEKDIEELVQKIVRLHPSALIMWTEDAQLLETLASQIGSETLIVSSGTLLGLDVLLRSTESVKGKTYFTYPYRLPQEDQMYDINIMRVLAGKQLRSFQPVFLRQGYIVNELLGKLLVAMRGEYYRDFFLDTLGMLDDTYFPLYERVSFGPDQRYISKGCFMVKVGEGPNPKLERMSEWVTH